MSLYRIVGGDVGTQIVFTVREWPVGTSPDPNQLAPVLNIASASSLKLILIPPEGVLTNGVSQQTVTAVLYTNGTDGNLAYTTVAGDIPTVPWGGSPQLWTCRAQFSLGGWTGKSETDTFWVDP